MDESNRGSEAQARAYLGELEEATMRRAWGEDASPEYRHRIVAAAIIFARQFEERVRERSANLSEEEAQGFLMALLNAVIEEFAEREGMESSEAAAFLGDVRTRDYVLEFNEVLDAYEVDESGRTLDEIFRETVESRREKAVWSRHWSSG
jgi:hypothetical protein